MTRFTMLAAVLATILAFGFGLAGCGKGGEGKPEVALVMKSLANEFFKTMEDGAREHQQANAERYALIAQGIKNEVDVNRQIEIVENLVAQGVDAIVIAPADSKALVTACRKAQQAGLVVVNIDNRLDKDAMAAAGLTIPFVGPDNREGARKAGDYLAERLEKGDKVVIIEGKPGAENARQRKLGFEDAMNRAGIEIVASQSANWELEEANTLAANLINAHPDIKAILCANDSMALGAVEAVKAADKLDRIHIVGFDNIEAVQQKILDGEILCTVDQHADKLAVFGIEFALEMIDGDTTPKDKETPVDLVTAEDLREQDGQ